MLSHVPARAIAIVTAVQTLALAQLAVGYTLQRALRLGTWGCCSEGNHFKSKRKGQPVQSN